MKKRFTNIMAALALLVFMAPSMVAVGQTRSTETFLYSDYKGKGTQSTGSEYTMEKTDVFITNTKFYGNNSYAHFYANGTTTITPKNGATITQIVLTANSTSYNGYQSSGTITASTGSVSGSTSSTTVTWTGSTSDAFTITNNKQIRWTSIVVTYTASGGTPTCVAPTFSPAAGTYYQAQSVTISTTTEGATIYYTLDGNDPTISSSEYTEALTISETTTVKAIAAADGYNNSSIASATYTITTPSTIAAVREQGTGSVFTQGIVTSCVGTTGYIQDNTAAICVYGSSLTVGDEITVAGTLSTYKGLLEITSPQVVVLSSGNTVTPTVKTIAEINADDYTSSSSIQGLYVTIEDATVTEIDGSNTTIAQGENTIVVRGISGVEYAVNDILTLNGNIGCYDGAQIANPKNVTVQENENPVINATTPATLAYNATEGFIAYSIDSPVAGISLTATSNADWISNITVGNESITFTCTANEGTEDRTATITLSYQGAENVTVTVTQGHYIVDYATLPFVFDGGRSAIETTDGLTQYGLGTDYNNSPKLKFDGTGDYVILKFNERPGILSFNVKGNPSNNVWDGTFTVQTSEDGENYTDLATYTELTSTAQTESFDNLGANVRFIKWIYTEKISGNVALGTISLTAYSDATTITAGDFSHVSISELWNDEMEAITLGTNVEAGTTVYFTLSVEEGYTLESVSVLDATNNTVQLTDNTNSWSFTMPNSSVTINAQATESSTPISGDKYVKVTSTDDLTTGQYLIVYEEGSLAFDGSLETLDAVDNTIEVTISNNEIEVNTTTTASEFTIDVTAGTIMSTSEYYIGQTSDANGLASSKTNAYTNTISVDENGNANIVSSGGAYLRYNTASNQNRFRYYKSSSYTGQKAIQLYKKVAEPITETFTLNITGYGSNTGGYVLIASPVTVDPSTIAGTNGGMTENDYDLYYFDESQTKEWINYKKQPFDLEPGKGYLYAHKTSDSFTWTGTPYTGNGEVTLTNQGSGSFAGCNLVGNPYNKIAYIADGREFYTMNDAGSALVVASNESIEALEGVFVIATTDGETMQFTTQAPQAPQKGGVILNISKAPQAPQKGSVVIDRAIVRFDGNSQLPKFQLFENTSKLYIPQGTQNFAVVNAEAQGELPVNFKAESNGSYTFSVNAENVEFSYLHLIDNMTGADIDLLESPSYSFEANTSDYESRFKLVFAQGDNSSNDNFAFVSNGEIIVNGEGMLQMFDVTGRLVYTAEVISAFRIPNSEFTSGVYVLQLNDKTQKIVLK